MTHPQTAFLHGRRSPAEAAFDFVLFPSLLYLVLAAAGFLVSVVRSDGEPVADGSTLLGVRGAAMFALIYWGVGVRRVWQSWDDPFGRVLRVSSVCLLVMTGMAVAQGFGWGVVEWIAAIAARP